MISIEASEAKNNLVCLIDQVAEGEQVIIPCHGVPVARLLPITAQPALDRHAAITRLKELSQGLALESMNLREMIAERHK